MKLYKYKAIEQLEHIWDILQNKRFYAAQFSELNDPMEGLFDPEGEIDGDNLTCIEEAKKEIRICAFSRTPNHPVLWAHYASNFTGICIEIDVPSPNPQFMPPGFDHTGWIAVDYVMNRCVVRKRQVGVTTLSPCPLFSRKADQWSYEDEVRAFTRDKYIPICDGITMTRVLLGLRIPSFMESMIRQLTPSDVSVWKTKIGDDYTIEIDAEMPLPNSR